MPLFIFGRDKFIDKEGGYASKNTMGYYGEAGKCHGLRPEGKHLGHSVNEKAINTYPSDKSNTESFKQIISMARPLEN